MKNGNKIRYALLLKFISILIFVGSFVYEPNSITGYVNRALIFFITLVALIVLEVYIYKLKKKTKK